MHALIIEDEPLIAMEIEDILRDIGYTSFAFAVSAREATDAAASRCPDLITSDVQLKPGNGMDAVEEICGSSAIPVIFITGNPGDVRERLPRYHVLRKPFGVADLEAAVEFVTSE
jgi:DNA-binding response OmpR family regulator